MVQDDRVLFWGENWGLKIDFANIYISARPSTAPWWKVSVQIVKEFEHQATQNISTLNFGAAFNQAISEYNLILENYRDSIKATAKQCKNQIQKGADSEKASRNVYEKICDYLEILDKRIQIQQRALACLRKALSHMLQRDLYVMGKAGFIRKDAEMTHLHPDLGGNQVSET